MPETVDDLIVDFATHLQKCKAGIAPILHKPFDRPPQAPVPRVVLPPTPEEIEADRKLQRRQREERRDIRAELQAEIDKKREKARMAIHDKRAAARKELADELKHSRKILRETNNKIFTLQDDIKKAYANKIAEARSASAATIRRVRERVREIKATVEIVSAAHFPPVKVSGPQDYPQIPPPSVSPHKFGNGLPEVPGIYFLWLNGVVDYVGQSIRIARRLQLGKHHVLREHHGISFLPFEERELTWVECYYIGICRPQQNFGTRASHYDVGLSS